LFLDQGPEAVIGLAEADAQRLRQLALGGGGVFLQRFQEFEVNIVGH